MRPAQAPVVATKTCGGSNAGVVELNYVGTEENNHWSISDNQFESSYWNDILLVGASDEADHFINRNKFGVPSYVVQSAADMQQYHIYGDNLIGTSIVDNWFFNGGVAVMVNCVSYKVQDNHARNLSQGVWDSGGGGGVFQISGNQIQGNNSVNSTTGSLAVNHWGIRVDGENGYAGPGNDVIKFGINYQVWAGATNNYVIFPESGGQTGSVNDGGTGTRVVQLDVKAQPLTLLNGWATAGFATPSYTRLGNNVLLKGMIYGGSIAAGTVIATLPAGYFPGQGIQFFVNYTDNGAAFSPGSLQLDISGNVMIGSVSAGTVHISLDGMSFSLI